MTPNEIEQLFSSSGGPAGPAEEQPRDDGKGEEGAEVPLSTGESTLRTGSLRPVLAAARRLWEAGSDELDAVAEKIGNGARDGKSPCGPRRPRPRRLSFFFLTVKCMIVRTRFTGY